MKAENTWPNESYTISLARMLHYNYSSQLLPVSFQRYYFQSTSVSTELRMNSEWNEMFRDEVDDENNGVIEDRGNQQSEFFLP